MMPRSRMLPLMNHVAMQVNAVLMLMIAAVVLGFSHETRGTLRFVLLVLTAICCVFGFWYLYSM